MRVRLVRQRDLFETIAKANHPWSEETQPEIILLLTQLMRAVIEAIEKETNNEQD